MGLNIAIAGNPNCGKTTLFNELTGSNQYVGNWPGVTVEKKEGKLKNNQDICITDLPGIYSLSPYTLEEVVARNFLVHEHPDAILNVVDGTNLERNLYLTTQLIELGIPLVVAVNMFDVVKKNGDRIDLEKLSQGLGCKVVSVSALKGEGIDEAVELAIEAAKSRSVKQLHNYSGTIEHVIAHIEEAAVHGMDEDRQRYYAVKLFERDSKVIEELALPEDISGHIEDDIKKVEKEFDDDSESIIINERYTFVTDLISVCYKRKRVGNQSLSDKIDKIVTNRILALPVFALAMIAVYALSIGTVGDWTVVFMNDGLFGSFADTVADGSLPAFMGNWLSVPELIDSLLLSAEGVPVVAPWLYSLIQEGIVGGVGAVLGFVPQMIILFLLLAILEDIGYMSRIAFIMDRVFRKFGLSGKTFIPMLIGCGCGVPGVMASRTIEQERDRRMTVMTTCFMPCGAKMPIVGLIAGALFGGSALVAVSAYFVGIAAVVISGIILKKTKPFAGEPAPFVLELPAYHAPIFSNVMRATWDRGWSFIKKAGTVIFAASVVIWTVNSFSFEGGFHYITSDMGGVSILESIGGVIAYIFKPLGFGDWQAAVATVLGLVAKEEVVGVFGTLSEMAGEGAELFGGSKLSAYSFMLFNLLCAPCFAAMGAIRREMNSAKWTAAAIGYMCVFAYAVSLIVYNIGMLFTGVFTVWTVAAFFVLGLIIYLLFRKNRYESQSVRSFLKK